MSRTSVEKSSPKSRNSELNAAEVAGLPSFVNTPERVKLKLLAAEAKKKKNPAKAKKEETKDKAELLGIDPSAFTKKAPTKENVAKNAAIDFIGTFPLRNKNDEKKVEAKKASTGPVFEDGEYEVMTRNSPLSKALTEEFQRTHFAKHPNDKLHWKGVYPISASDVESAKGAHSSALIEKLVNREADIIVLNMKDIPMELPAGIVMAAALKRDDPRDAMVTRSTYGSVRELPRAAKVGANSKRRIMQLKNIRQDLQIMSIKGDIPERLAQLEAQGLDAILVAWSGLRRLNISPRYYVALQPEHVLPAACQGIAGVLCRSDDINLVAKLNYIEDSEASWATRCERAFLQKISGISGDVPVGAFAHRKGTQDPWILDCVVGDARTGEVLRHREIGTSRCKPESLADKAFVGIVSKGSRKFTVNN